MNLKSIYKFFALGLLALAGQSWATVAEPDLPKNQDPTWNDISSIVWRTNGGAWGTAALTVGQTVEFQFTLHKEYLGTHYADFMKVWIDWSGNGSFEDASDQVLLFKTNVVHGTPVDQGSIVSKVDESYPFTSAALTVTSQMLGDHYLLARVTCSESLLRTAQVDGYKNWDTQWNVAYTSNDNGEYNKLFSPTKYYYQGESELVKLHVDPNKVPEPGTLALLAVGMAGIGFGRRRLSRV